MVQENYERVTRGLRLVQEALAPVVHRELAARLGGKWWTDGVLPVLSDIQRSNLPSSGQTKELTAQLDVAALIQVLNRNWEIFGAKLSRDDRTYLNELASTRNRWAHAGGADTPAEDAFRALDTMARLLQHVQPAAAKQVRQLADEVHGPAAAPSALNASGRRPGLRPWREVVTPHPDVSSGRYLQAEFAADLAQVLGGKATVEYQDPLEFFGRTFLTDGLRRLLVAAIQRLGGGTGDPVIQLKTAFGGGKTHAMLALYHLLGGQAKIEGLPGIPELIRTAQVSSLPRARTAVLVGTDLSPAQPWPCRALNGRPVRTLWGELAAQVGGAKAYEGFRRADEESVPPGAGELVRLFESHGPVLILVDELVAFARTLYGKDGLSAGTFDANLTFLHNLTEAVKRSPTTLLVLTIPASDIELGGQAGKDAMARIEATVGRLEAIWRPVAAQEGFEIVRRRLFLPVGDEAARDTTCRAFGRMYAEQVSDFPPEAREGAYLERLRAAYPIHPEVFDRLYEDWSTLERFQRTRGVLRLMAAAVYELWTRQDAALMILPGTLPLDAPRVRDELTRYLAEGWNSVVDTDVDGDGAEPTLIDRENPRLGQVAAARRVARAVFLGSAPSVREQQVRGIEDVRVRLGVVQAGESVALFNDALARLQDRLTHLYGDGRRLWYDTQPNLLRTARDRAGRLEAWQVEEEVRRRLKTRDRGDFAAVQVYEPGTEVPDEPEARLVVIPFRDAHRNGGSGTPTSAAITLAGEILDRRGSGRRQYKNTLLFMAAAQNATESLDGAVRQYLAWQSIVDDASKGLLNVDLFNLKTAREETKRADTTSDQRLQEAYCWLLVPTQTGTDPIRWEPIRVGGSDPYVARATRKLRSDELLITQWSPALLRRELDRWMWDDQPHVSLREVWEALASYCYLPRLKNADVLRSAVAAGVRDRDYFGYADGVTDDGRYLGLRFGDTVADVRIDAATVLVRPEVAMEQLAQKAAEAREGSAEYTADPGSPRGEGTTGPAAPAGPAPAPVVRRFYGSVALDPLRTERDLNRVVMELLQHITGLVGVEVEINLDISASVPDGFPPEIVRVLKENSRTLKFRASSFEER